MKTISKEDLEKRIEDAKSTINNKVSLISEAEKAVEAARVEINMLNGVIEDCHYWLNTIETEKPEAGKKKENEKRK